MQSSWMLQVPAFVECSWLGQDNPDNARHLGGQCDNGLVRVHSALQPFEPASKAIAGPIQMSEALSRAMNEEFANVAVPALC